MAASATTGVLNPLLGKLGQLLGEEYKKLTGVRKQASFLKDELSAMKALLDKMELMDKLDPTAKNWRDHIREMSYDMENCIDDFIHDIQGADAKKGFVRKMARRLRRLGRRHQIANRIEELKVLAVEANARRERYRIDDCINSSYDTVVVDPRMTAIYKEATGLVGIDAPKEELVSLLMDSKKELKVVSIVGFGGLGKTTLASKVYDEIGGQFNCMAFVSVSQRPNVKNLLSALQFNIGIKDSSHVQELQDIINRLREHLKHMRYFILVDDLWDEPTWNIISCAFPENANGSRVMVTTRLEDVAVRACGNDDSNIYRMKHLEEKYSTRLFCNRVFGSKNVCPPQFEEILAEILKKCGGLPLSIITISSLLASQEARLVNEWEIIKNSLGAKFATKPTLEEMRGILNLSYMHLPVHLRPCFLYLGMYPEDREILRDDLVRQWIAEGFVCSLHGDLDGVAISYFNELINRSLIQPEKTHYGEVLSCRVHDMMLDLILSKCAEDNFIIVAYDNEDMERLHRSEYKVRRLSLKSSVDGAGEYSRP
ncbi:disease resistance protein RGA5-like [Triticum dicoccoides]|uniref:disease resistance protein RGA5-like n=1 Tax=Triticum dicoccoides TaxID=85692 RepID=UPI000E7ACCA1|nr:disease resistance protein RGA5-like [Triticum dicoccoides]